MLKDIHRYDCKREEIYGRQTEGQWKKRMHFKEVDTRCTKVTLKRRDLVGIKERVANGGIKKKGSSTKWRWTLICQVIRHHLEM